MTAKTLDAVRGPFIITDIFAFAVVDGFVIEDKSPRPRSSRLRQCEALSPNDILGESSCSVAMSGVVNWYISCARRARRIATTAVFQRCRARLGFLASCLFFSLPADIGFRRFDNALKLFRVASRKPSLG